MPIVQIHLMEGRDNQKKEKLIKNVTQAICDSLEVDPQYVRIILSEMAPGNYAVAGELYKNKKK